MTFVVVVKMASSRLPGLSRRRCLNGEGRVPGGRSDGGSRMAVGVGAGGSAPVDGGCRSCSAAREALPELNWAPPIPTIRPPSHPGIFPDANRDPDLEIEV